MKMPITTSVSDVSLVAPKGSRRHTTRWMTCSTRTPATTITMLTASMMGSASTMNHLASKATDRLHSGRVQKTWGHRDEGCVCVSRKHGGE